MQLLKDGFRLSKGNSSFWFSNWTQTRPLCNQLQFVHISDSELCVRDVWQNDHWNWNMLASWIPSSVKNIVDNLPSSDNADMDDAWCWALGKLGCYTTSSAYAWLLSHNRSWLETSNWSWIWHLHAPEKVRFLFWLILHNAIPTNLMQFSWGLEFFALCDRSNMEEESILHSLRDCPLT